MSWIFYKICMLDKSILNLQQFKSFYGFNVKNPGKKLLLLAIATFIRCSLLMTPRIKSISSIIDEVDKTVQQFLRTQNGKFDTKTLLPKL